MSKSKLFVPILFLALFLAMQLSAWGAAVPTVTQTIQLNAGWNAVYLEVQPLSNSPAVVFKDLPAGSSVWAWQGKHDSAQFIQDPSEQPINHPSWLAIFTSAADSSLNNLYAISANSAYLINIPPDTPPLTINVTGRPTILHKSWIPDSFNLVGFGFAAAPPTFGSFFAPSKSHTGQAIYRLNNATKVWEIVNNPGATAMRSGEAFWIYSQKGSDYQGPLTVEANGADGLDFGNGITSIQLTLGNPLNTLLSKLPSVDKSVTITQLGADSPVAMAYQHIDVTSGLILTDPLSGMPPVTVTAGSSKVVTLVVDRAKFRGLAASVLEVTDGLGNRIRIPVTAGSNRIGGLWSGVVTLDKVSQVSDLVNNGTASNPDIQLSPNAVAKPTPAPLNLNLILHQDASGKVRLLKQAYIMYKKATSDSAGRYAVLTKDSEISNPIYTGVTQRDGANVGRRLSAVGFDFTATENINTLHPYDSGFGTDPDSDGTALKCSGNVATTVTCQIILESSGNYTHPTNPFLHKYHPDHDNLDSKYEKFSPEVNRIKRDITLTFSSTPRVNPTNPPPGWGVTRLGGTYTEYVRGLAKGPIKMEGNFTLNLAADVETLNQ